MLIHDFHSKLMSGNEEGKLFQALRKMRSDGQVMASEVAVPWSVWVGESSADDDQRPGWAVWTEESSEAMSRA